MKIAKFFLFIIVLCVTFIGCHFGGYGYDDDPDEVGNLLIIPEIVINETGLINKIESPPPCTDDPTAGIVCNDITEFFTFDGTVANKHLDSMYKGDTLRLAPKKVGSYTMLIKSVRYFNIFRPDEETEVFRETDDVVGSFLEHSTDNAESVIVEFEPFIVYAYDSFEIVAIDADETEDLEWKYKIDVLFQDESGNVLENEYVIDPKIRLKALNTTR